MKIAYVTTYDSSDVHAWSGLGCHILRALQGAGCQTESVGNLSVNNVRLQTSRLKRIVYLLQSKKYLIDRAPNRLKHYAAQVDKRLESIDSDIVFAPETIPIAHLKTEKPIVFYTDASFAGMLDFYPTFSNLCAETIRNGNEMEQLALSKCRLAIYSSEWAANSAIQNYDVDPAKVKVVPFGANIDCSRNSNDIQRIIDNKQFETCKLLFLGVEWERKGGEKALEIANLLNQRGLKTELHVVGCNPPIAESSIVKKHGFISKQTELGRKQLDQLLSEAHFLVLPSKAECCAVVFAEASSFGLPSLATQVGGIPTAIQNGKNGCTFPLDEPAAEYCQYIESLMSSPDDYRSLALSSFQEYSERMNWNSAGSHLYQLMQTCCG